MAEIRRTSLGDLTPNLGGPGERNHADVRVGHQRAADLAAGAGDQVQHPAGQTGLIQNAGEIDPGQWRCRSGLEDHGIPQHQRRQDLPGGDSHGEVPGRDHSADAQRLPHAHGELTRQLRGGGVTELATAFPSHVEAHVDGFLHVTARFLENLAHLPGHFPGQLFLPLHQHLGGAEKNLSAPRRRGQPPSVVGRLGGGDSVFQIALVGGVEVTHQVGFVSWVEVLKGRAGAGFDPFTVDVVLVDFGGWHLDSSSQVGRWGRLACAGLGKSL